MSTEPAPQRAETTGGRRLGLLRVALEQSLGAVFGTVAPAHPTLRRAHLQLFWFDQIDGATTVELAAHLGMTKQSMHELVTHLERHGYLVRGPHPNDARARAMQLTDSGRALERDINQAVTNELELWRGRLGSERFDILWSILENVTDERNRATATRRQRN